MTVAELIDRLSKMPPDAPVKIPVSCCQEYPCGSMDRDPDDVRVYTHVQGDQEVWID